MLTCFDIADYFLSCCDSESGELMSNLKIQKLVYYGQGFSLALLNKALFKENIEAWMYGPVIPKLYEKYKKYGQTPLPFSGLDKRKFTQEQLDLLAEVYHVYGQFSAWKLKDMTYQEAPWRETYIDGKKPVSIPINLMKQFFLTRVVH